MSDIRRAGFFVLGCMMLVLGFIGALLPVMPTTIFLILAAWCFGRSSPRLEAWLLRHPRFGPVLVSWREKGAIPQRAKYLAYGGILLGYVLFLVTAQPAVWAMVLVGVFMAAVVIYIATRPVAVEQDTPESDSAKS